VVPRVASRDAGYGFGPADAEALCARGARLIITGDCGTSDIDAIAAAARNQCDVVVIDHHTVPASAAEHPALALINPFRADSTFEFPHFASVGLGFYVMQSVRSHLRRAGYFERHREPDLRSWLDLVALGTVADLVPLTAENRVLTSLGLRCLDLRLRPGIRALLHAAGVDGDRQLGEREVGWTIAPRLNAPGRLGDAEPSLALLLAGDGAEAERRAAELEQANDERRVAQAEATEEALAALGQRPPGSCVVVAGHGWKPGVVGIVASRLVDLYDRPAFVIAVDPETGIGRGSARTAGDVDIYRALAGAAEHIDRYGGHAAAAGLTIAAHKIDDLRGALELEVESQLSSRTPAETLADAAIEARELTVDLVRELSSLAPFGKGNPEIRLVARGLEVAGVRAVGTDRTHLKLDLRDGAGGVIGAIGFGLADRAPAPGQWIDVAFAPLLNRWRGTERAEMQLVELAPSSAAAAVVAVR
jgi:single-stranded-DNA-specific exonuclease